MKIGGLVPFSLSDFPGCASAVVFTQGCNFRCPFCHNSGLIGPGPAEDEGIPVDDVVAFLSRRRGKLDGVVVSGGEPTLQPDLPEFLHEVRSMGFAVKLDTNGSRPDVLQALLQESLVDFVAMDIKAPLATYERLAGTPVSTEHLERSMLLIVDSGVRHEFRTTVVPPLLSDDDVQAIRDVIPSASPHRCQAFRPEHAADPALRQMRSA